MYIAPHRNSETWRPVCRAILPGDPIDQATARSLHARLLNTAAARRLRAFDRALDGREEDALYWKGCAPAVIRRAAEVRCDRSFQRLPG
jgi:hypothetical protein